MENLYVKTDDNKIINVIHIRWVKKMEECLSVCARSVDCNGYGDTHKICKLNTPDSYNKLNNFFE